MGTSREPEEQQLRNFSDHLKTASVITDSAGVIKSASDYYP
jgi:hypothetical protein